MKDSEREHKSPEHVPAKVAQQTLPRLVAQAQYGERRTVITKNGQPAAAIVPIADLEKLPPAA